jgi:tRNA A37 N6-isopentenylltransferase MiaA
LTNRKEREDRVALKRHYIAAVVVNEIYHSAEEFVQSAFKALEDVRPSTHGPLREGSIAAHIDKQDSALKGRQPQI